ncbi:MAG: CsbD family protein [Pseudomonadota bacterium]
MNKNQVRGAVNEAAGKLQKKVGKATANGTMAVKGAAREMAGKAEKSLGNAREDIRAKSDARTKRDRTIDRHAH